jgi:hypothetical protein
LLKAAHNNSMENQLDDKAAYLEWVKSWTEEDKKVVLLLIAFDLGTISLLLSGKTGIGPPIFALRGLGLVCLLGSAGFYYLYFHRLHLFLRGLCPRGDPLSPEQIDERLARVWRTNRIWFRFGGGLMFLGLFSLIIALWRYF